jgi:hypothetical protein
MERFSTSIDVFSSSATSEFPSSQCISQEPAPHVEIAIAYSPAGGFERQRGLDSAGSNI